MGRAADRTREREEEEEETVGSRTRTRSQRCSGAERRIDGNLVVAEGVGEMPIAASGWADGCEKALRVGKEEKQIVFGEA